MNLEEVRSKSFTHVCRQNEKITFENPILEHEKWFISTFHEERSIGIKK